MRSVQQRRDGRSPGARFGIVGIALGAGVAACGGAAPPRELPPPAEPTTPVKPAAALGMMAASTPVGLELTISVQRWKLRLADPPWGDETVLRLPVGEAVGLTVVSSDDAYDLVGEGLHVAVAAGQRARVVVRADRAGSYALGCTGTCGGIADEGRAGFVLPVEALTAASWTVMLEEAKAAAAPTAARGQDRFVELGCSACHAVGNRPKAGPPLGAVWGSSVSFADGTTLTLGADNFTDYVVASLYDPNARLVSGYPPAMPDYRGQLAPTDVEALLAYLACVAPSACPATPACAAVCE